MTNDTLASLIGEGMHTGLRKGSEAADSGTLWSAISDSDTTAWRDAARFTAWGFEEMGLVVLTRDDVRAALAGDAEAIAKVQAEMVGARH